VPWSYRPGNSILHRAPAGLKLLGLAAFSAAVFAFGPAALAGAALFLVLFSLIAGINPWELVRGSGALFIMILVMLVFRSVHIDAETPNGAIVPRFDARGALDALIFGGGILASFAAGALFFSVTTMTEIKDAAGAVETGVFRLKRPRFGLAVSLMLGFLPRFFETWETASLAWKARAGKRGLRALSVLVPLVIEQMMEHAAETAAALEARGLEL
jgi:energy-coupling factor transporter transmembrane protein EcfT